MICIFRGFFTFIFNFFFFMFSYFMFLFIFFCWFVFLGIFLFIFLDFFYFPIEFSDFILCFFLFELLIWVFWIFVLFYVLSFSGFFFSDFLRSSCDNPWGCCRSQTFVLSEQVKTLLAIALMNTPLVCKLVYKTKGKRRVSVCRCGAELWVSSWL